MEEALLRILIPTVIGMLVRRGADVAAAEDAVQDALVAALRTWPGDPPRDPRAWLVTVAWASAVPCGSTRGCAAEPRPGRRKQ